MHKLYMSSARHIESVYMFCTGRCHIRRPQDTCPHHCVHSVSVKPWEPTLEQCMSSIKAYAGCREDRLFQLGATCWIMNDLKALLADRQGLQL